MVRAHRQAATAKFGAQLADATFVQIDGKRGCDAVTQVRSAKPLDIFA